MILEKYLSGTFLGIIFLSVVNAEENSSLVRFINGDQLTGTMVSLTENQLVWNSPLFKQQAEFDLKKVIDLQIKEQSERPFTQSGSHLATLNMTNGDELRGQLIGMTDSEVTIGTSYSGELKVKRLNLNAIDISSIADLYYAGPNHLKEWTQSNEMGAWTFRDDALYAESSGGLAREIDFPEEFVISFQAAWRGAFRPQLVFLSKDIRSEQPVSGYILAFQGNSAHLRKGDTNQWLGHSTNAGILREIEKAEIEIKVSLRTQTIALFVNHGLIDVWKDNAIDKKSLGKGLHFISQDDEPLRISQIRVESWDGHLDTTAERKRILDEQMNFEGFEFGRFQNQDTSPSSELALPQGRMRMRNGDDIEGEVVNIINEEITLKTAFAEVKLPISRLRNIALERENLETPKLYKEDVRATFVDESEIVFRLDGVEEGFILGFSQNFGKARFRKDAFKRIEFNIYDEQLDIKRKFPDW